MKSQSREKIVEIIYFALNNWDINPMTKGFAKELAKELLPLIDEAKAQERTSLLGEIGKYIAFAKTDINGDKVINEEDFRKAMEDVGGGK